MKWGGFSVDVVRNVDLICSKHKTCMDHGKSLVRLIETRTRYHGSECKRIYQTAILNAYRTIFIMFFLNESVVRQNRSYTMVFAWNQKSEHWTLAWIIRPNNDLVALQVLCLVPMSNALVKFNTIAHSWTMYNTTIATLIILCIYCIKLSDSSNSTIS